MGFSGITSTFSVNRILIVQHSAALDGSAHSGLLVANGLREAGWATHVAFGFEGPIIERYAAGGHHTHVVPHKNWLRRKGTPQFVKDVVLEARKAAAFSRLIDATQPDVVYLNTAVSLAGAVGAWIRRRPAIWHLREMFADIGGEMRTPNWALPLVRSVFQRGATRLVANSRSTAENLLGEHATHRVSIIPNAVRSDFFEEGRSRDKVRRDLQLPANEFILGIPGTLRPMKGHDFFLRAVEPLLAENPSLQVALTGGVESRYAQRLIRKVSTMAGGNRVHFLGWVEDMPAFYRACDLICVPSRAEPFGRTVIEAFATGTPVVATAVGGIKEIIDSGTTGLLVRYGDATALREALRRLFDTPHLRQKMSERARQVAEKKYHEQVYKNRVVSTAREVTHRSVAGGDECVDTK